MKFREHRGGLAESLATCRTVDSLAELEKFLLNTSQPWERNLRELLVTEGLKIAPYGYDDRIGWDTHIVTLAGYGVIGFTDGAFPLPVSP